MNMKKKLSELETLQTADDNNEDAMKDRTFIRTLRARLQLMATELESKADKNDLVSKADIGELSRLASQINFLRRSALSDRDIIDSDVWMFGW